MRFASQGILSCSLLAVISFRATAAYEYIPDIGNGVVVQFLNHSNEADGDFHQRFWYNKEFYNGDGPVFLETAGEWDPNIANEPTYCAHYARFLNALCLRLEHRYYGESSPLEIYQSRSYTAGTFRFLSVEQAIEDVGKFIEWIKDPLQAEDHGLVISPSSKWVVFGCSYGGTLAAWSKQRFPHLLYAAVISSAPMEARLDYAEFNQGIQTRFHQGAQRDAWFYQQCTEFGWFNVGFGDWLYNDRDKEYVIHQFCDQFNENISVTSLEQAIDEINWRHHGKKYFEERVIMVHGGDDVWKTAGIYEPDPDPVRRDLMPVIIIPHAKHCEDIKYPPFIIRDNGNWDYPPEANFSKIQRDVLRGQDEILKTLRRWLQ